MYCKLKYATYKLPHQHGNGVTVTIIIGYPSFYGCRSLFSSPSLWCTLSRFHSPFLLPIHYPRVDFFSNTGFIFVYLNLKPWYSCSGIGAFYVTLLQVIRNKPSNKLLIPILIIFMIHNFFYTTEPPVRQSIRWVNF